jgi:single-strand DNA-binding protein
MCIMRSLNRVIISGHLGKDPETTPAGATTVTKFSLAVNDRWKDSAGEKQERVNWLNVSVWNGNGENIAGMLKKGSHVLVEGSIRTSEWDDKESGQKRYGFEVVASQVIFLDRKEPKQTKLKKVK